MGKKLIAILFAGCSCGVLMYAQSNGKVTPADRAFMNKAAQGGMAEVQLGQLAEQKASSQAVKDFGQRMVTDHNQANNKLMSIASKQGVTLPTTLNAKDQALFDRLSKLSGTSFDKAYMRAMVRDHHQDIAQFNKEAQNGKDEQARSFASSTLPTLEKHLTMAKRTAAQVGASSQARSNSKRQTAQVEQ